MEGVSRIYTDRMVVTGAGSGIGRAVACLFAEEGYTVYGLSRSIEEVERQVGRGRIIGIRCDVTDEASVRDAVARIGDFSIIVHSAGFGIAGAEHEQGGPSRNEEACA